MKKTLHYLFIVLMLSSLTACGTISGWFSSDDDEASAPAALTDFEARVNIRRLWSQGVGDGQGSGMNRIQPVISGDTIYAASANGRVIALDRRTGKTLWRTDLKLPLSGGVGVYGDALLLGTGHGYALKLDARSGERLWMTPLQAEILAPPQANGRVVVAQTYDGKLRGLDFASGAILWTYDSNMPVLTIRGTSTPIIANDRAFAGFANGRVVGFDTRTGSVVWESRVAIAQGRSEIERIVDIDGSMELAGNELFAASYQGHVAAIDAQSGRMLWQQEASTYTGVSLGFGNAFVAQEDGTLTAYYRNGQGVRWTQGALANRQLSRPTPVGSHVAVGDFEGYVHILSPADGEIVGRVRADRKGVRADMLSRDDVLYIFGNGGTMVAYEITAK